jgi:4-alpha-glucanotransferase
MDEDLATAAALWGIETSYTDVQGRRQEASPETIRRIVDAVSASGFPPKPLSELPAPPRRYAFQGDGRRGWLLAVQLYAVRSGRNWGHGDFGDLRRLVELAADIGAAGIGVNPLHALFPDRPEQASPYAPNSRLFLNSLYIDVTALPEFAGRDSEIQQEIAALQATDMVDYTRVAKLKLAELRKAYSQFSAAPKPERLRDFEEFCAAGGKTLDYFAVFETLRQRFESVWWEWPEPWRKPNRDAIDSLSAEDKEEVRFQKFMQWVAGRQLGACRHAAKGRGMAVGLYLDLAVGVDAGGADAWLEQEVMLTGLSVGAPPDTYNPAGQDWGLTTYNPHGLIAREFEPLRRMLREAMRYAGAVRLDHVLGLMRLFVIPHGLGAARGAYLRCPFETHLSVVADESQQNRCIVIGEDLGTVPEGFRETVAGWGLWSYLVVLFLRDWDGSFQHPSRYAENALATFNTHDLPTYYGWLTGHDLKVKRGAGVEPGESDEERENARRAWAAAIGEQPVENFEAAAAFLAATPTRLVSIGIEDVMEVKEQTNLPGTVDQHPNWRRRLPVSIEDLAGDQRLLRIADVFRRAGRSGN